MFNLIHNLRNVRYNYSKHKLQGPSLTQVPFEALGTVLTIFHRVMLFFENFVK